MRTRRLSDQIMMLEAIIAVKAELRQAHKDKMSNLEMSHIFTRLLNLYASTDVTRLKNTLEQIDNRTQRKKAA